MNIIPPHVDRMIEEARTLELRIDKLNKFIGEEHQKRTLGLEAPITDDVDFNSMVDQLSAMHQYAGSLSRRLVRALLKSEVI